jgi:transposase
VIDMLKRHAIQVLRQAGHTLDEIVDLVAVGRRTVQRVVDEPMITQRDARTLMGADHARGRRRIGRPSKADAYRERVTTWLAEEPALLSVELLRRATLAGYDGAKSALYELVRSVRVVTPRPVIRFEGLPGEFTQHDFGEVVIQFLTGTTQRVHFFASRLKYSRWVEVTLVPNEQVETLARTLVDHFAAMGGIPLLAVFDRPKTVALSWKKNGEVTEWNPVFAGVVLDLGLGIAVCWPPAPQQKGAIENLVGWVKGSFFKQRRFLDHEDLLTQLAAWLREVNPERPSRATGVVPAVLADVFNSLLIAVRQFDATAPILKDPFSTIRLQRRRVGC